MIKTPSNAGLASAASVPAEAAKRVIEFDIRMSQFAGGAPMNGVDDDQPAMQAAIDYAKTLGGRYTGGTAKIRIPRNIPKLNNSLVVTGATNVSLSGEAHGSTTLKGTGNFPIIYGADTTSNPLYRFRVENMTIEGPGASNVDAHGIRLGANNNCYIDASIFSCRRGISLANSWQTTLDNIRIDGQGALACYDGLYLEDGNLSVVENAVLVLGGLVHGVQRFGIRGESVSGSKVFGLEVLGCGNAGVYLGESPGGKDLKWFSWVGGLVDTCPDLIVVKKGSSTIAEEIHFSGMWLGYASEGAPGVGIGVEFVGLRACSFQADMITNVSHAANIQNCSRIGFEARVIEKYDRQGNGAAGIICNNTTKSRFAIGATQRSASATSSASFVEQGTSNHNYVTGCFDRSVTLIGANSKFDGIQATL